MSSDTIAIRMIFLFLLSRIPVAGRSRLLLPTAAVAPVLSTAEGRRLPLRERCVHPMPS
jgi:hypothetical protein